MRYIWFILRTSGMSLLCMQEPDKHLAEAWGHTLRVISWAGVNGWYMSSTPIAQPCRKHQAHLLQLGMSLSNMGLLASNKVTQRNMTLPSLPASGLHLKDLLELCLKTAVIASYLFHAVICHFSERSVSGWTQGQDPKLCKHGVTVALKTYSIKFLRTHTAHSPWEGTPGL